MFLQFLTRDRGDGFRHQFLGLGIKSHGLQLAVFISRLHSNGELFIVKLGLYSYIVIAQESDEQLIIGSDILNGKETSLVSEHLLEFLTDIDIGTCDWLAIAIYHTAVYGFPISGPACSACTC